MKDSIFHTNVEMPSKNNDSEVMRVAQTRIEMNKNYTPASIPNRDASVVNLPPVNRGKHY